MQFTVPEAAKFLHVSIDIIYQWIRYEGLPASRLSDQYSINRVRLLEWANKQKLAIGIEGKLAEPILEQAMSAGKIFTDVKCEDLLEFANIISGKLPTCIGTSTTYLADLLGSRKTTAWHEAKPGVLVPAARAPIILPFPEARVFISYLKNGLSFADHHRKKEVTVSKIHSVILIVVPSAYLYLNLLLRTNYALRDDKFVALLKQRATKDDLLKQIRRKEEHACCQ